MKQKLRPSPHVLGYFLIRNSFFPDSKIFPSARSVFKSNSLVQTHPMVSGFTLEKRGLHLVPPSWVYRSIRDWKRFFYVIRLKKIAVHTFSDALRFLSFLSTLKSGLKNIRMRCRIRRMRGTGALSGEKKSEIKKYPDTCGAMLF